MQMASLTMTQTLGGNIIAVAFMKGCSNVVYTPTVGPRGGRQQGNVQLYMRYTPACL